MRKKLLISLAGVLGFLFGGLLITSFVLASKINSLAKTREDEPKLELRGILPTPKLKTNDFKHTVCDYFPVKIRSETPEDLSYGKALCDVTFRGEKLALIYQPGYVQNLISIFNHPVMGNLRDLSVRKKIEMVFESRGPGEVSFLLSRSDFQQSLLYLMNGMSRKFKSWAKYEHSKYLIYVWDISRGSFEESKVQLFTDDYSITCMGPSCFDYLFSVEIL